MYSLNQILQIYLIYSKEDWQALCRACFDLYDAKQVESKKYYSKHLRDKCTIEYKKEIDYGSKLIIICRFCNKKNRASHEIFGINILWISSKPVGLIRKIAVLFFSKCVIFQSAWK